MALFAFFFIIYLAVGWAISNWYGTVALAGAAIFTLIMAAVALWGGDDLAVMVAGGKQLKDRSACPVLWDTVETAAIGNGLQMPRVFVSPDPTPNAFAAGRTHKQALICVNRGLLERLDKQELEGVVAHEMGHIRNLDVQLMTYAAVLAGSLALLSELFLRLFIFGGSDNRSSNPIVLIVSLVAIIIAPIAAIMIQMAISRRREFVADAAAADSTRYPQGLASALERIASSHGTEEGSRAHEKASAATAHMYIAPVKSELSGVSGKLFSTHPPTSERVEALLKLSSGVRHNPGPPVSASVTAGEFYNGAPAQSPPPQ